MMIHCGVIPQVGNPWSRWHGWMVSNINRNTPVPWLTASRKLLTENIYLAEPPMDSGEDRRSGLGLSGEELGAKGRLLPTYRAINIYGFMDLTRT